MATNSFYFCKMFREKFQIPLTEQKPNYCSSLQLFSDGLKLGNTRNRMLSPSSMEDEKCTIAKIRTDIHCRSISSSSLYQSQIQRNLFKNFKDIPFQKAWFLSFISEGRDWDQFKIVRKFSSWAHIHYHHIPAFYVSVGVTLYSSNYTEKVIVKKKNGIYFIWK